MSLLQNSNAISDGGVPFAGFSLRSNATNTNYLSRTQGTPTDGRKWTFSFWVKRGVTGNDQTIISAGSALSYYMEIGFQSTGVVNVSDQIYVRSRDDLQVPSTTSSFESWIYAFRDPSAWQHIVISVDTTAATDSTRMTIYVNNKVLTGQTPPQVFYQNAVLPINSANGINIGRKTVGTTNYFDGALTDIYFVDGQALTPSSFGETNVTTGQWEPKLYSGTYGNNGYYLPFTVGSSTVSLGADQSGNGNNWTLNNYSRSVGINDCWLKDYPVNETVSTQPKSNYCVLNPADNLSTASLINGNLQTTSATTQDALGSIFVNSGKWYWECQFAGGSTGLLVGVHNGTTATSVSLPNTVNPVGVRFDRDAGTLDYSLDGISWTSIATGLTSGRYAPYVGSTSSAKVIYANFGQREFRYLIPIDYKCLCTSNIAVPVISNPKLYFDIIKWIGNDTFPRYISGLSFRPDFVWTKVNQLASHGLYDIVRGPGLTNAISTNSSTGASTLGVSGGGIISFDISGFNLGAGSVNNGLINTTGYQYFSWNWKGANGTSSNNNGSYTTTVSPNTTAGFTVFKYTSGFAGTRTIGHGLGVAPQFLFIKNLSQATDWAAWHTAIGTNTLSINNPYGETANAAFFNSSVPNSSVIPLGYSIFDTSTNSSSGNEYVGYAFAEVDGLSKIGSVTGTGNADGAFVYCGFRPKYILIKNASQFGSFVIFDTNLNEFNPMFYNLEASSNAFIQGNVFKTIDFLANGFKITGANDDINKAGSKIIYMALADSPFNTSNAL